MHQPLRTLLKGKWLALHLTVVVLCVAMVLLGRWQLHVSEGKGFSLQNFFYAFQWWVFTAFLIFFWIRVMRDAVRTPAPTEATGELVVAHAGDAAPAPGAAMMVADDTGDGPPVVYRGYIAPQMGRNADRTGDTTMRDPYNDHLWQLALADAAKGEGTMPTASRPLVDVATLQVRAEQARALEQRRARALGAGESDPDAPATG